MVIALLVVDADAPSYGQAKHGALVAVAQLNPQ